MLITMLAVRGATNATRTMQFATNLLLAGTVIFGGGPVVIPLLRGYTVDPGWSVHWAVVFLPGQEDSADIGWLQGDAP